MRDNPHPVTSNDYKKAKQLRKDSSFYEKRLWHVLRMHPAHKTLKFRRQQPIHPYVVDFACMKARLVVELDGASHDSRQGFDQNRDAYLEKLGYYVLRFGNDEVMHNVEGVVTTIVNRAVSLLKTNERTK